MFLNIPTSWSGRGCISGRNAIIANMDLLALTCLKITNAAMGSSAVGTLTNYSALSGFRCTVCLK